MSRAYMGTPGVVSSVVLQHAFGHVLLIDRKRDTWERCVDGKYRWAVMVEPRRRFTTFRSPSQAREEQARISELSRRQIEETVLTWGVGQ